MYSNKIFSEWMVLPKFEDFILQHFEKKKKLSGLVFD